MPLFSRPDGDLVRDLAPVRRLIPYLMRGRNESVVYYEQILDLTRTLPFVRAWNETHPDKLTVFHLLVAACGKALHARPGLNRFVSGGRIYQRRGAFVSFAAKARFQDDAPLKTVKVKVYPAEPLEETVKRLHASVGGARDGDERPVDKEVRLVVKLPGVVLRLAVGLLRLLDRVNLLPGFVTRDDPMYASVFLANLGSVGIDRAWHHLYEYGTVSIFGTLGEIKKMLVPDEHGAPVARDAVRVRYAFDERVNDGFYCAASLDLVRAYVEDPELFARQPEPPPGRPTKLLTSAF
jgi:pyruvate/2-oxoglutarate dehydrogenase complex dihydrolipoamide acyltransferase (E2) component